MFGVGSTTPFNRTGWKEGDRGDPTDLINAGYSPGDHWSQGENLNVIDYLLELFLIGTERVLVLNEKSTTVMARNPSHNPIYNFIECIIPVITSYNQL